MTLFANPIKLSLLTACAALAISFGGCDQSQPAQNTDRVINQTANPALVHGQNWQVNPNASFVSFISVKNTIIVESHNFPSLGGGVSTTGAAEISIDLGQVKTGIDIRNQRLKKFVFKTDQSPLAVIKADLDAALFTGLKIGDHVQQILPIQISLAGHTAQYDAYIMVSRMAANKIQVNSVRPVLLDIDDFDLEAGVEILRNLAKLDTITPIIPVTFSVQFEAD